MKFKNWAFAGVALILFLSLFRFFKKPTSLEVYDINKSFANGEVSVKNLKLISSGNDVYLTDSYYFSTSLRTISAINLQLLDAQETLFYSQSTPLFFEEDGTQTYWNNSAPFTTEIMIPKVTLRHNDVIYLNIQYTDESGKEYHDKQAFTLKKNDITRAKP